MRVTFNIEIDLDYVNLNLQCITFAHVGWITLVSRSVNGKLVSIDRVIPNNGFQTFFPVKQLNLVLRLTIYTERKYDQFRFQERDSEQKCKKAWVLK